eukprot:XP_028350918.1 uncharacterized protein LOC114487072 [Physeter catodon]
MVGGWAPGVGARAGVLSEPGRGHSQPQLFVFARAGLLSPAEQKKERVPAGCGAAAPRERSVAGAKRRRRKARRGGRPRRNGDGPEPVSAPTARRPSSWRLPARGPGLSRLPPPTPGPSGPESPVGDARPRPGPALRSRLSGLRSELSSGTGFKKKKGCREMTSRVPPAVPFWTSSCLPCHSALRHGPLLFKAAEASTQNTHDDPVRKARPSPSHR